MSITLTALAPAPFPPSYLLTIDSAKILLDCGTLDHAPEQLEPTTSNKDNIAAPDHAAVTRYLDTLRQLAPTLNLVLLSHPLLSSLGLLPWLRANCDLRCPVYATLPTREMGRWAVEEWVQARSAAERNQAKEQLVASTTATANGPSSSNSNGNKKRKVRAKPVTTNGLDADTTHDGENSMAVDGKTLGDATTTRPGDTEQQDTDPWEVAWKVTAKDIRESFLTVNAVRWTQPVHLSGPLKGYTLVAHRSGHTLGGSLFTIRPSLSSSLSPASSSSSLLYAPIFNHVKEHHLDGAALLNGARIDDAMRRMGVVVVGADRSLTVNTKRVDRERKLLSVVTSTMEAGGSVLLPTDPSARVLELLVLLESHWTFAGLTRQYPLCLISRTGRDVVAFVRSLTEWMGGQVAGQDGDKILRFSNLRIYPTLDELNADIPPEVPKTILTVPATLSHGYSRGLFVDFARNPKNIVILTGKSETGTLAHWLWNLWNIQQAAGERWGTGKVGREVQMAQSLTIQMKCKVFLEGDELEAHLEAEREAAEREAKHQAVLERSRRMIHADADSDSDSDDDDEEAGEAGDELDQSGKGANGTVARRRTGGFTGGAGAWDEFLDASTLVGRAGGQSFDIYVKGNYGLRRVMDGLPRYRMFPVVERKRRVDAYGEAIDVEGWLRRGMEDDPFGRPKEVVLQQQQQAQALAQSKRAREEEEAALEQPEAPHKYIVENVEVPLNCSLFVVDMEGASDGRALKTILPQINPRKLVLSSGSPEAVADLAEACKAVNAMTEEIFTPGTGERVTVGQETKNFSIRLGDNMISSLRLSRVEDYDVAYVSGVVHIDPESGLPVLERTALTDAIPLAAIAAPAAEEASATTITTTTAPVPDDDLTVTPAEKSVLPPLAPALFIGDLRLTLLKDKLAGMGVPSELAGEGILICGPAPPAAFGFKSKTTTTTVTNLKTTQIDPRRNAKAAAAAAVAAAVNNEAMEISGGRVAVKKTARGKLVLEGTPGETYFVVRKAVYSMHASAG